MNSIKDYNFIIPSIKVPFAEMNSKQSKEYFDWFVNMAPQRGKYLFNYCIKKTGEVFNIWDGESLRGIWKWFLNNAETEVTPIEQLRLFAGKRSKLPEGFKDLVIENSKERFSLKTELLLMDIGMYVGTMFDVNTKAYWGYYRKPKSDYYVNQPVLLGFEDRSFDPPFKMVFEPIHMVHVQAANIWDKTSSEDDLLNLYNQWMSYL